MARLLENFYRGDTVRIPLTFSTSVTDDDGVTTETPIDITDYVIWTTLKSDIELSDEDAGLQVATVVHTDPANGQTELVLEAALTTLLEPGKYSYDIQTVTPDGDVSTIECGIVKVYADVTRVTVIVSP